MAWAQGTAGSQGAPLAGDGPQDSSAQMAASTARQELHEHNKTWLHDPDVNQLDFILCVAIAGGSAEDGEKLWGIVVSASSQPLSQLDDLGLLMRRCKDAEACAERAAASGMFPQDERALEQDIASFVTRQGALR